MQTEARVKVALNGAGPTHPVSLGAETKGAGSLTPNAVVESLAIDKSHFILF